MPSLPARAAAPCLAAILLAAAPVRADGTAAPDPARLEEAKRHMRAGVAFYKDPAGHKCEEALREFRKAYELSGALNPLKAMAVCTLELERDGESIQLYLAYLAGKGASIEPAERAQVEGDLNLLRASVAGVTLSADRPGARVTDVRTPAQGSPIRNTYTLPRRDEGAPHTTITGMRFGIHPGQHVFTASAEGMADQVWQVEIANGGTYVHTFTFTARASEGGHLQASGDATPAESRPVPAYVWTMAGLTMALTAPWIALAVRAKNRNDDYREANGKEPQSTLVDLRNEVKSANLLADVFLGATLASLTTTVVTYLTRPTRRPQAGAPGGTGARSLTVTPGVGVSSGGARLPPAGWRGAVVTGWF